MSLPEEVASGDLRRSLVALRDVLAVTLTEAEPKERAPLARQLTVVLERIAAIPEAEEESLTDELRRRREARRRVAGAAS